MLARARECTKVGSSRGKHVCFHFDHPNVIRVSVDECLCSKDGHPGTRGLVFDDGYVNDDINVGLMNIYI